MQRYENLRGDTNFKTAAGGRTRYPGQQQMADYCFTIDEQRLLDSAVTCIQVAFFTVDKRGAPVGDGLVLDDAQDDPWAAGPGQSCRQQLVI